MPAWWVVFDDHYKLMASAQLVYIVQMFILSVLPSLVFQQLLCLNPDCSFIGITLLSCECSLRLVHQHMEEINVLGVVFIDHDERQQISCKYQAFRLQL